MREIGDFIEVEPGLWVPKSSQPKPPLPITPEKPEPKRVRDVASILAPLGIAVDTSRASVSDIAEERRKKKQEHADLIQKIQQKREAELEAEAKNDLDSLLPVKQSQIDHRFLEVLRGIWARNPDGSVNYRETLKARHQYLDEYQWRIEHGISTTPEGV